MDKKKIQHSLINVINTIGGIGILESDDTELKTHKRILTFAIIATISNLFLFSFQFEFIGRRNAAMTLIIFSILNSLNLVYFVKSKNLKIFRNVTFTLIHGYIIFFHVIMGGYLGSVNYMIYGVPALIGVYLLYHDPKVKRAWFILYIITSIILYLLEPIISKNVVLLPNELMVLISANNFILIAVLVVFSSNYFTSIIKKERQKSDSLLLNILPQSIAEEIKNQGKSKPKFCPMATIIFMDFVGFTRYTHKMSPEEIVYLLNEYFTEFDYIFLKHKVEKLKTIGDGYMAVSGATSPNASHAVDAGLACLEILNCIDNLKKENVNEWNIRIGMHCGPVVAGVIGETKFSFDVWGSTVNLASRLESTGLPMRINVSDEFVNLTQAFFEFEHRGLVEVKNLDPVNVNLLLSIKIGLKDELGIPNGKFHLLYYQTFGSNSL